MKVDGKQIASKIFDDLKNRVARLQAPERSDGGQGEPITPHLAVILVGENPASEAYVLQKQLRGKTIDANIEVLRYSPDISAQILIDKIRELNANSQIHGIIVQRPLPEHIDPDLIENEIADAKDVDGFKPGSPFYVPLVLAVMRILEEVYKAQTDSGVVAKAPPQNDVILASDEGARPESLVDFLSWLQSKKIVLFGKGSTAGQPIMDYFKEKGIDFEFIERTRENPEEVTQKADIIISSVGKKDIIKPTMIKNGVILIGVGINKDEDGHLYGDYEEDQIKDIASFYTPTPGGVGPVNVAMLLENLITSAEQSNPLSS